MCTMNLQKREIQKVSTKSKLQVNLTFNSMLRGSNAFPFEWTREEKADRMARNVYVICNTKEVHIWQVE